jgi:hypothetical protein
VARRRARCIVYGYGENHEEDKVMLQLLQPTTGNVVAITGSGTLTADDYESVLFQLQPNTGFTAGAVWDDTKFGLSHFFSFEKFALVSDTEWINNMVKVRGFMMPCPVKLFALSELPVAKEWISE